MIDFQTQLLHETKSTCTVFVLQPIEMSMRNTGTDTNQKKPARYLCFSLSKCRWEIQVLILTRKRYLSWWSPLWAEIFTIFPSFCNSRVGLTRSTTPLILSCTSNSCLNLSVVFIVSFTWSAAVDTKWRASTQTQTWQKANSLDTRQLVTLQHKNTGNAEQSQTTTNNKTHCCINVTTCFDFMFGHHPIALNSVYKERYPINLNSV